MTTKHEFIAITYIKTYIKPTRYNCTNLISKKIEVYYWKIVEFCCYIQFLVGLLDFSFDARCANRILHHTTANLNNSTIKLKQLIIIK